MTGCVLGAKPLSAPMPVYCSLVPWKQISLKFWSKLEQLERLRFEDTPTTLWLPILLSHIGSQVKRRQSQSYKFKEFAKIPNFYILKQTLHMTHLLKLLDKMCKYMKWIQQALLKIQSGHDSVHRQTDGQTDRRTRWNQNTPFQLHWSEGIIKHF